MNSLPSTKQLELITIYSDALNPIETAYKARITVEAFYKEMISLEKLLGTKLFAHEDFQGDLTADGRNFVQEAKLYLTNLSKMTSSYRRDEKGVTTLKVGALLTMGGMLLCPDIIRFEEQHPHIKLHIVNQEAAEISELLENDDLDVAILFGLDKLNININKYEYEPFFSEDLVFYAPNVNHSHKSISLADTSIYQLAEYAPHYIMNATVKEYLQKYDIKSNTTAWFTDPHNLIAYCLQTLSGSFQCERLLHQLGFYEGYYHLEENLKISYSIFTPKSSPKKEAIATFLKFLHEKYA